MIRFGNQRLTSRLAAKLRPQEQDASSDSRREPHAIPLEEPDEQHTGDVEQIIGIGTQHTVAAAAVSGNRGRILVLYVLPALAVAITGIAGALRFQADSLRADHAAETESVRAATSGTIAILSYHAETVERDLTAAEKLLTGSFRGDYNRLIRDTVIPGSRQKTISATAVVPAASAMSASTHHAVVLVYVDQEITVGSDAPTSLASSVKVTLDHSDGRWLIAGFEPV